MAIDKPALEPQLVRLYVTDLVHEVNCVEGRVGDLRSRTIRRDWSSVNGSSMEGAPVMTQGDRAAGSGAGPDATGVEPSAAEPEPAHDNSGEIVIPLGRPVGADELRALKRRAEQPDPSAEWDMPMDEGDEPSDA